MQRWQMKNIIFKTLQFLPSQVYIFINPSSGPHVTCGLFEPNLIAARLRWAPGTAFVQSEGGCSELVLGASASEAAPAERVQEAGCI